MHLTSYLFFDDTAAEAFEFYAKCLGGKITWKTTFAEMPGTEQMPPAARKKIAHIRLEVGDAVLMASDWTPPDGSAYPGIHGNRVCLGVEDPGEAERLFASLSEGGSVMMPIGETSWSLRFAMFTDRYGAHWMINCERPR